MNAATLANPDLDLRYRIPDLVVEATGGSVQDDGYDYSDTEADVLIIYFSTDNPEHDVRSAIETSGKNEVCGNRILESAVIGVSNDARSFRIVHPPNRGKLFTVEWFVQLELDVPWAKDPKIRVPVTFLAE